MDSIMFEDSVLVDFTKLVNSNTVKGIEVVSTDPGNLSDDILYLIMGATTLDLRFNANIYSIVS
ncbi:MAG: hypothetical protein J6T15_05170 [Bacilli bacterium]|nr:hypothetical protein [Bacilli bacterium]